MEYSTLLKIYLNLCKAIQHEVYTQEEQQEIAALLFDIYLKLYQFNDQKI